MNQHPISLFIITQKDPFVKQENDFFCALADDRILSDIPRKEAESNRQKERSRRMEAAAAILQIIKAVLRLQQQS